MSHEDHPASPVRHPRWRLVAWPLAIVAAAAVVLGACELAGWPFLKDPAQRQLSLRLQRPVVFGDRFRFKVVGSIRLDTNALRIGAPQGLPPDSPLGGELADARDVHLEVPYSTLMQLVRGRAAPALHITSLRLGALDASLKRNADGRANWTIAQGNPPASRESATLPAVDELVLRQGRVVFDDGVLKTRLDARVNTREGAAAGGSRGLAVEGRGTREDRPFVFHVTSAGVLPLVSRNPGTRVPIAIRLDEGDAKFAFDGTATDLLGFEAIDGQAMLSGPSLAKVGDALGITLPTTEPFQLKGRLSKSGEVWALGDANLAVGSSRLAGSFKFDRSAQVPMLSGELRGSHLVLADLLPAFGASRQGTGNPKPPPGHVVPQREFDIPSLHRMDARVALHLQRADLGSLFRQPLAPLQGDLSLQDGVLRIDNLLARAAGGQVRGDVALDARQKSPLWSADLRWAGVDLDQFLRARNNASQVPKPSGENPGYVTGKLGGHAQLKARGKSTAQMIGSTDGTLQAWVRDGALSHLVIEAAGIDAAQALGVWLIGDKPLPMRCAIVKANARNGRVTPEVAIVDTTDSTLFASGWVSLADESMDLTLTAKPKDASPLTLRAPVHLRGSFAHPQVALEKKPVERKLLASAALALVNPLAALIPLVDMGDKEAAGGCQRTLQRLHDADGPAGAPEAKAPRPGQVPPDPANGSGTRQAAGPAPVRK